jgi:hypothetical protein
MLLCSGRGLLDMVKFYKISIRLPPEKESWYILTDELGEPHTQSGKKWENNFKL